MNKRKTSKTRAHTALEEGGLPVRSAPFRAPVTLSNERQRTAASLSLALHQAKDHRKHEEQALGGRLHATRRQGARAGSIRADPSRGAAPAGALDAHPAPAGPRHRAAAGFRGEGDPPTAPGPVPGGSTVRAPDWPRKGHEHPDTLRPDDGCLITTISSGEERLHLRREGLQMPVRLGTQADCQP